MMGGIKWNSSAIMKSRSQKRLSKKDSNLIEASHSKDPNWLKKLTERPRLAKVVHFHMCLSQPLNEGEETKYVNNEPITIVKLNTSSKKNVEDYVLPNLHAPPLFGTILPLPTPSQG